MRVSISIFLLFVSIVIFSFLIYPKYQNLSRLKKTELLKKAELENFQNYSQQLKETFEKLQNYKEEISKIELALPENLSIPEFFNFVQKLAALNGLSLKNIDATPSSEEGILKEWKTNLTLSGDYQSFKNFLSSLEKSARLVEIENISFSSPKEKEPFEFKLGIKIREY